MTIRSCPQCSTLYLGGAAICDWCAVETKPAQPVETKPAAPWECWNEAPVNTDAAMDATRVMCGGGR